MASTKYSDGIAAMDEAGFSIIPVGTYDVRVDKVEATQSSKGNDMFVVDYVVITGPHANKRVRNWMVWLPQFPGLTKRYLAQMAAMGLPKEYFAGEPADHQVCADLTGKLCQIMVEHRKNNKGDDTEDITAVLPPSADALAAPTVSSVASPLAADAGAPNLPPF